MDGTGKEQLCGKINDLPMIDPGMHMLGGEKRIVFGPERFWPTHVMRCFTLKPGGKAASNRHPWVHWFVCIAGQGKFQIGDDVYDIGAGYWVYVPEEIPHSFWNTSETEDLISLCTVTKEGDTDPLALTRGC